MQPVAKISSMFNVPMMKIFVALSESPLKFRKMTIYRFLIPLLVPELLRFKDLENDWENGTEVWVKSIKINKFCDIM